MLPDHNVDDDDDNNDGGDDDGCVNQWAAFDM